jgi:hypothetical protein
MTRIEESEHISVNLSLRRLHSLKYPSAIFVDVPTVGKPTP